MIKTKIEQTVKTETNKRGDVKLSLSDLAGFDIRNPKLKMFSLAELKPGEEVEYHKHVGECEYYYIISGVGVYNDNGEERFIAPGTVTFTPSGESHGIKNTGGAILQFIALIIEY